MGHAGREKTGDGAGVKREVSNEPAESVLPDALHFAAPADETPESAVSLPMSEDACDLVQVRIPGQPVYISVARQAVDAVSEQIHLPPDARSAVKLAVGEACNNAVLYGRQEAAAAGSGCALAESDATPTVLVACRILRDALEIDVTNEGNGFHPLPGAAAMPLPEALSEHGRGLALMETVMDSVEYLSRNGRTVVRMRKCRSPLPLGAGSRS